MLLFDIGAILVCVLAVFFVINWIFPSKFVRNLGDNQKIGCLYLMIILSMIGGIVMVIAHYIVAGIPEAIKLW